MRHETEYLQVEVLGVHGVGKLHTMIWNGLKFVAWFQICLWSIANSYGHCHKTTQTDLESDYTQLAPWRALFIHLFAKCFLLFITMLEYKRCTQHVLYSLSVSRPLVEIMFYNLNNLKYLFSFDRSVTLFLVLYIYI